jgi:CubicO group peptidase (beta-lactamase class C family)
LIDGYVRDDRFAGAILVTESGHILIDKGYGQADRSAGTPNTPGHPLSYCFDHQALHGRRQS